MPGMMETILNVGLNENTIQGVFKKPTIPALRGTPTAA